MATLAALDDAWASIDDLFANMAADDWSTRSLCPEWDVREALSHVASIEEILVGWWPSADDDPPPFAKLGPAMAEHARLSGPELFDRYRKTIEARRAELAGIEAEAWATPCMTPVGPGNYGRFMEVRTFDFWVHERDVRIPLGRPAASEGGPAAEIALDEVHNSLGYICGKKIAMTDGQSIRFVVSGGVDRTMDVVVDGRAKVVEAGDAPEEPTTTVEADSTTFIMLACGRIDPQGAIDDGTITWTGDAELGERAARNLRFTM